MLTEFCNDIAVLWPTVTQNTEQDLQHVRHKRKMVKNKKAHFFLLFSFLLIGLSSYDSVLEAKKEFLGQYIHPFNPFALTV